MFSRSARTSADRGLLLLPLRAQGVALLVFAGDLGFDLVQTLAAGIIGFTFERLAFDFKLQHAPVDFVQRGWLCCRFPF